MVSSAQNIEEPVRFAHLLEDDIHWNHILADAVIPSTAY